MEQDLDTFNTLLHITSKINRVDITSTTIRRRQPPTLPPQFLIRFNFSCKSNFSFWLSDPDFLDHHLPCGGSDSLPPEVCSTVLGLRELLDRNKARRLIRQRLGSWFPFRPRWRRNWIDQALERAREDVDSMPASHNTVVVDFRVIVHHAMVYHEEEVGPVVGDDGTGNFMVPAAESWIESVVEKKIVMDSSGTCTVCLDDFSDGSEGVSMPCAHIFHGDCINKWLRTSHYCPVCRFEFPTD